MERPICSEKRHCHVMVTRGDRIMVRWAQPTNRLSTARGGGARRSMTEYAGSSSFCGASIVGKGQ
ncbi:hypothetical protein AMTR_s00100p00052540 [Amborella trichopoda]|uniref:Uncharacterized protein n=1 Tax=Amborella trichopoda TaxID=13333 RepID=W1NT37_AMBTC|nr:hypothetical protein AMTR_s00100p00052540 [Amborella trichopoda]